MAKKDPMKRAATRQRLIDAYINLYRTHPGKAVTASEVIGEAGVNRSTFYEYFTSVQNLKQSVEDELVDAMEKTAERAIASSGSFDIINLVSQTYHDHGALIGLLFGENGSPSFMARAKEALTPLVPQALAGRASAEEAPYIAEFIASGLISLYARWFKSGEDIPVEELAPLARQLVFACIEPPRDSF